VKRVNWNSGFTIIETILFLAVSTSMLFVAMNLISGRSQQVQFTDSIRAIESYIDSKISQIKTGSIALPNETCRSNGGWSPVPSYPNGASDGSCVFLGYIFELNNLDGLDTSPVKTVIPNYQIFGTRINSSELLSCKGASHDVLYCATPNKVPASYADNFTIPWSLNITKHIIVSSGADNNTSVSKFGYLRDPSGTGVIPVAMIDSASITDRINYDMASLDSWVGGEFAVKLCFSDGSRLASVNLGGVDTNLSVEAMFDDPACI